MPCRLTFAIFVLRVTSSNSWFRKVDPVSRCTSPSLHILRSIGERKNPCLGYDVSSTPALAPVVCVPCTTCLPPFLFTLELAHTVSTHHCVYSLITSIWRISDFAPERSGLEFFSFFSFSSVLFVFPLHE